MKFTDNNQLLTTTIDDMKFTEKKIKKSEKNFVDSNNCCIFVLGKGNNPTTKVKQLKIQYYETHHQHQQHYE